MNKHVTLTLPRLLMKSAIQHGRPTPAFWQTIKSLRTWLFSNLNHWGSAVDSLQVPFDLKTSTTGNSLTSETNARVISRQLTTPNTVNATSDELHPAYDMPTLASYVNRLYMRYRSILHFARCFGKSKSQLSPGKLDDRLLGNFVCCPTTHLVSFSTEALPTMREPLEKLSLCSKTSLLLSLIKLSLVNRCL